MIFGCEHFVLSLDRHEAKQTYGGNEKFEVSTYNKMQSCIAVCKQRLYLDL